MKYVYIIAAFICAGISIWMGYEEKYGATVAAFAVFFALVFRDRIVEVSIGRWFNAKLKEVGKKVDEANATLDQLRRVTGALGTATAGIVIRVGRWGGGYDEKERSDVVQEVVQLCADMGVSAEQIDGINSDLHNWNEFDYALYLLESAGSSLTQEAQTAFRAMIGGVGNVPSPQTIKDLLVENDAFVDENKERFEDYRYYCEHRTHRRPDEWFNK